MGTFRRPKLSDSSICRLYREGEARFTLCMLAGITDYELAACLKRNGVAIRTDAEWKAIARASRARWKSNARMTQRLRRAA